MSLVILIVLVLGVGAGYLMPADVSGFLDSASTYMLLLLLFSVGIDTGLNKAVFTRIGLSDFVDSVRDCARLPLWRRGDCLFAFPACKGGLGDFRRLGLV